MQRPETPHVPATPLTCEEFRTGGNYTNWRPSGSGDWLLLVTVLGAGRIGLPDRFLPLPPLQAILYHPTARQDYATDPAVGSWDLQWAHFAPHPHWLPWLRWPEVAPGIGHRRLGGDHRNGILAALERMLTAKRRGGILMDNLAMNALEQALILLSDAGEDPPSRGLDPRVNRALHYLASNPAQAFSLDALARRCALSPSRLSHLFKQETGTSPHRYQERIRLESARRMLAGTHLGVAEIAASVGFEDPLYFSRRFKRHYGEPPSAFAARARQPNPAEPEPKSGVATLRRFEVV